MYIHHFSLEAGGTKGPLESLKPGRHPASCFAAEADLLAIGMVSFMHKSLLNILFLYIYIYLCISLHLSIFLSNYIIYIFQGDCGGYIFLYHFTKKIRKFITKLNIR